MLKGVMQMIKKIAWNTFKNTGNIDTFLEFKQIRDIENSQKNINLLNNQGIVQNLENPVISMLQKVETDGNNKNQWNNNF